MPYFSSYHGSDMCYYTGHELDLEGRWVGGGVVFKIGHLPALKVHLGLHN